MLIEKTVPENFTGTPLEDRLHDRGVDTVTAGRD